VSWEDDRHFTKLPPFPELPGWEFEGTEVTPGSYIFRGRDLAGRSVSLSGPDPERLREEVRKWAMAHASDVPRRRRE
jgi:hypothetical protein